MLSAIVRFSLRFRGIVIALACALLGYGLYALTEARYDVFPEFAPPEVEIQSEAPGLSPEQVEVLVTQPIENAIVGVSGIDSLRSGSVQGLSVITVVFRPTANLSRPAGCWRTAVHACWAASHGIQSPADDAAHLLNQHCNGGGPHSAQSSPDGP